MFVSTLIFAETAFILPADPYRRVPLGSYGFEDILPAPQKNQPANVKVDRYAFTSQCLGPVIDSTHHSA